MPYVAVGIKEIEKKKIFLNASLLLSISFELKYKLIAQRTFTFSVALYAFEDA